MEISKHIKQLKCGEGKRSLYLYQEQSQYYLYLIDPKEIGESCMRISSEQKIQLFQVIGQSEFILIDKNGKYIIYRATINNNIQIHMVKEGTIDHDNKIVGLFYKEHKIHLVMENAQIMYISYTNNTNVHKYRTNQNSNNGIVGQYLGRQYLKNEGKLIYTQYINQQLYLLHYDPKTILYSIYKVMVQEYNVKAGNNCILNIKQQPLSIQELSSSTIIINLGNNYICWNTHNNTITNHTYPQQLHINHITKINNVLYGCNTNTNNITQIYKMMLNETQFRVQRVKQVKGYVMNIVNMDIYINKRLQLCHIHNNELKPLIHNHNTKIQSVQLQLQEYHNIIRVHKVIGNSQEYAIFTNNRVVYESKEYLHNILLKMAKPIHIHTHKDRVVAYFSNPMMGTFGIGIQLGKQGQVFIQNGKNELGVQQQCLMMDNGIAISHNSIKCKIKNKMKKIQVNKLLQDSTDTITAGTVIDEYLLVVVQQQIHVFELSQLKPLFIHCFDGQVKQIVRLNNINIVGCVLWDDSEHIQVYRIYNNELVYVDRVRIVSDDVVLRQKEISINAVSYICNVIGQTIIMVSNEQYTKYQHDKLSIIHINYIQMIYHSHEYSSYDSIELVCVDNAQSAMFIVKVRDQTNYKIVTINSKYLVKNNEQIFIGVQEVVGFPYISTNILLGIVRNNVLFLLTQTNMYVNRLKSGNIRLQRDTYLENMHYPIPQTQQQQQMQNRVIKLSENDGVMYNEHEVWYVKKNKNNTYDKVSYFSKPNNAFLQFRNNLSVEQLTNEQFMKMFAHKLRINKVSKLNHHRFIVLYSHELTVLQIGANEGLAIRQQIRYQTGMNITQVMGVYDENSIYLKDSNQRLMLLKEINGQYELLFVQDLDQQLVCRTRVKGWKDKSRKIYIGDKDKDRQGRQAFEQLIIKKDGQLMVGQYGKSVYL